jgi:tryptophan synthase alpha chain
VTGEIFKPNRCAFIPYLMAGDPDLHTTAQLVDAMRDAGADAIELGIPYGDPLADGPTIAAAGVRALTNGVGIAQVLELVRQAVTRNAPPIVLFTYYNPVYQYGIERFAQDAAQAGAAGVIVPDIALEEGQELRSALASSGLQMPLLVAPSTPRERAAHIAQAATGFVYVVSRLGVTGAGAAPDFAPLRKQVAMLREVTGKPLAIGNTCVRCATSSTALSWAARSSTHTPVREAMRLRDARMLSRTGWLARQSHHRAR